jgi:hypothetical protein
MPADEVVTGVKARLGEEVNAPVDDRTSVGRRSVTPTQSTTIRCRAATLSGPSSPRSTESLARPNGGSLVVAGIARATRWWPNTHLSGISTAEEE